VGAAWYGRGGGGTTLFVSMAGTVGLTVKFERTSGPHCMDMQVGARLVGTGCKGCIVSVSGHAWQCLQQRPDADLKADAAAAACTAHWPFPPLVQPTGRCPPRALQDARVALSPLRRVRKWGLLASVCQGARALFLLAAPLPAVLP